MNVGDTIHAALEAVGITPERVSKWLGKPCHCPERIEKLNQLGAWAKRVLCGKTDKAAEYLNRITEQP